MTETITVEKANEVFMKVLADPGTRQEISEYFSFQPEGYKFSPKYKIL